LILRRAYNSNVALPIRLGIILAQVDTGASPASAAAAAKTAARKSAAAKT